MKTKPFIIYHGVDNDGFASAAIAKSYYDNHIYSNYNVRFYPINYNVKFNLEIINSEKYNPIIMLDFTLQKDNGQEMVDLINFCKKKNKELIWIDHHKLAIDTINSLIDTSDIKGTRKDGTGACELAWTYFYPDKEVPSFIKLLSLYDVWNKTSKKYDWNTQILPFQMSMKLKYPDPIRSTFYNKLINKYLNNEKININTYIKEGNIINSYQNNINKLITKNNSVIRNFKGHKAIVANSTMRTSLVLENKFNQDDTLELMAIWAFTNRNTVSVSLYSNGKTDCAKLAKICGQEGNRTGGGHKNAAGFEADIKWFLDNISNFIGV